MRPIRPGFLFALFLAACAAPPVAGQGGAPVPAGGNTLFVTDIDLSPPLGGAAGRRGIRTDFSGRTGGDPVLGPEARGAGADLLRSLYARGLAAGNHGDLYENRDREHSLLDLDRFPQLTRVRYGPLITADWRDYGAAGAFIFDAPLIGNSSTAETRGPFWRSQARAVLTRPIGALRLYQNYRAGQIYVYPEHRDHDPEQGDLIPANTPYMLISQGSSFSDKAHLRKLAMILAAFRPDTKARLKRIGLLGPTVQMVYRRSMAPVRSREAYLSGVAHPSVFDRAALDPGRAVALANSIVPDAIAPMVTLQVVSETQAREGIDYFGRGVSERFFDTPAAIARIWRSRAGRREMTVTARETEDPNGRPLSFRWVLLRGDPDRVQILPEEGGRTARIVMDWQTPQAVPGLRLDQASEEGARISARIDIGVFAHNGIHDSAPSFISVLLPRHETRTYATGPDGAPRVVSIDRRPAEGSYADPRLFPQIGWRDVYEYDSIGRATGWIRETDAGTHRFDESGEGPDGRPIYRILADERGVPMVEETLPDAAK